MTEKKRKIIFITLGLILVLTLIALIIPFRKPIFSPLKGPPLAIFSGHNQVPKIVNYPAREPVGHPAFEPPILSGTLPVLKTLDVKQEKIKLIWEKVKVSKIPLDQIDTKKTEEVDPEVIIKLKNFQGLAASKDLVWFITPGGLLIFNPHTQKLSLTTKISSKEIRPNGLIWDEPSGLLWLFGNGLYQFDPKSNLLSKFEKPLAEAIIKDILPTPTGIWIITETGLIHFDRANQSFNKALLNRNPWGPEMSYTNLSESDLLFSSKSEIGVIKNPQGEKGEAALFNSLPYEPISSPFLVNGKIWFLLKGAVGVRYQNSATDAMRLNALAYLAFEEEKVSVLSEKNIKLYADDFPNLNPTKLDFDNGVFLLASDYSSRTYQVDPTNLNFASVQLDSRVLNVRDQKILWGGYLSCTNYHDSSPLVAGFHFRPKTGYIEGETSPWTDLSIPLEGRRFWALQGTNVWLLMQNGQILKYGPGEEGFIQTVTSYFLPPNLSIKDPFQAIFYGSNQSSFPHAQIEKLVTNISISTNGCYGRKGFQFYDTQRGDFKEIPIAKIDRLNQVWMGWGIKALNIEYDADWSKAEGGDDPICTPKPLDKNSQNVILSSGLWHFQNGKGWEQIELTKNGQNFDYVTDLKKLGENLWIGTDQGILRYDLKSNKWSPLSPNFTYKIAANPTHIFSFEKGMAESIRIRDLSGKEMGQIDLPKTDFSLTSERIRKGNFDFCANSFGVLVDDWVYFFESKKWKKIDIKRDAVFENPQDEEKLVFFRWQPFDVIQVDIQKESVADQKIKFPVTFKTGE